MGQILGKITVDEPEGPRGPDLMHRVEVPEAWFREGVGIEVALPRRLACARCEGGGCDVCGRSGAIALRGPEEAPEIIQLSLPEAPENGVVVLKLPEAGAYPAVSGSEEPPAEPDPNAETLASSEGEGARETLPEQALLEEKLLAEKAAEAAKAALEPPRGARGMLFLRVSVGVEPSAGVVRTYGVQSAAALSEVERRRLMQRSALLVSGLLVLFLVMLWLSGWL